MSSNTALARYVFLDVVGFTKDRTVEAQSDIVARLNEAVRNALSSFPVAAEQLIVIPTGDGLCICFLDVLNPFDIQVSMAVRVLGELHNCNAAETDPQRKFEVRFGINENTDNVVIDYNKMRNVAGAGISFAQRIMDKADGSQILVSGGVYETLRYREKYKSAFREFNARGKHGIAFRVYQYVDPTVPYLNTGTPQLFRSEETSRTPAALSDFAAVYIALAAQLRPLVESKVKNSPWVNAAAVVAIGFLATDVLARLRSPSYEPIVPKSPKKEFRESLEYYATQDYWMSIEAQNNIVSTELQKYSSCFESHNLSTHYAFPSKTGIEQLDAERPGFRAAFESIGKAATRTSEGA